MLVDFTRHLLRDLREWNESYLFSLPLGEFDWLEVKGRRAIDITCPGVDENDVRNSLSKSVCAFANSGGGSIVYGLSNPKASWQVDDGGISIVAKMPSTREWLEDTIPTLVDMPLQKFNVYAIPRTEPDSLIAEGRAIFVIHIADSEQAPHQAIDKRYYARIAGKSRPISHRFVLDILGRRKNPKVTINCSIELLTYTPRSPFDPAPLFGAEKTKKQTRVSLVCRAKNSGQVYATYVSCRLSLPLEMLEPVEQLTEKGRAIDIDGVQYVEWVKRNTQRDVAASNAFGPKEYGPSWFDPILPELFYSWEWQLRPDLDIHTLLGQRIYWIVHADNAPMESGSVSIGDLECVSRKED